jgi:hypothetical protein
MKLMVSALGRSMLPLAASAAAACLWAGEAQVAQVAQAAEAINPPPKAQDWAELAKLPDWSGVWVPDQGDQNRQVTSNPPPWNPAVARQIAALNAQEEAGNPKGLFIDCLPEGMPSWMLITHNAMEILFTPGRVTLLGESDGSRLRRIYTDGRGHPDDPDPTFHGHSIGHWEGDTLVVDTIGVVPQTWIAVSEAVGIPNDGDLHVVERIHLAGPDVLHDDLEITAPHVLTGPWKTTRIFKRQRAQKFDIVEGECLQGSFHDATDSFGNAIYAPVPQDNGNTLAPPDPAPHTPATKP